MSVDAVRARLSRPWTAMVWTVWLISVVAVAIGAANVLSSAGGDAFSLITALTGSLASISLATVGAILVTRLPGNRVGWLLWGGGTLLGVTFGGTTVPAGLPGAVWLGVASNALWVPAIVTVGLFVPLFFPTGRLPSQRWRLVVAVGIIAAVIEVIVTAFSPFDQGNAAPASQNPLALGGAAPAVLAVLDTAAIVSGVVCFPAVAASLVVRYRGASGVERAQLRWFAAAGGLVGLSFAVAISAGSGPGGLLATISNIAWELAFVGLALLPIAIGIAITRYRLYDIDLIIRRTAVYIPLTAALAGIYAASIASLQRLFIAATGTPSDGAVILSTLVLAATFTPIKNALQGFVDRRFRDARDADRRLQDFVDAVAGGLAKPDRRRLMRGFLAVAVEVTGAASGAAYHLDRGQDRPAGAIGQPFDQPALTIPVEVAGVRLGRIDLAVRRDGRPYREHEVSALREAGIRVAAAALSIDLPRAVTAPGPGAADAIGDGLNA